MKEHWQQEDVLNLQGQTKTYRFEYTTTSKKIHERY